MSEPARRVFEFGPFLLEPREGRLLRDGRPVPLAPKTFELLVLLVERSGHLVGKNELVETLWPNTFVEEANLNNHLWRLRRALGESRSGHEYIETVPKRGFRFVADVRPVSDSRDVVVEQHTLTHITALEELETTGDESASAALEREPLPPSLSAAVTPSLRMTVALVAGAAVIIAAAIIASRAARKNEGAEPAASRTLRSIAVLPFKTIGADVGEDFLGIGLADALITRLGNVPEIVVRPTSAVRRYTDPEQDPLAIGRRQGVDAVLDGSLQREGDRVRVTIQLYRVADGAPLWSGKFDEGSAGIFELEDSISQKVAEGLLVTLSDEQKERLQRRERVSVGAHEAYLMGRYFWNKRNEEAQRKGLEHFQRAIAADPTYAQAYAGLADSYLLLADWDPQQEMISKARAAAERAIELDGTLAEAHTSLALIAQNYDWNWAEAEKLYRRAIDLNPNYPVAHHWYGEFLAYMGRFDEGIDEIARAQELNPLSPIIRTDVGVVFLLARRYDRSVEALNKVLEIDPTFLKAHSWLAGAYSFLGAHEEAFAEASKALELDEVSGRVSMCAVKARAGRMNEAQTILRDLIARSKRRHISPWAFAMLYTTLGEKDQAFAWLEKTYRQREVGLIALKTLPTFDPIRDDPRFRALLRRLNFES